MSNKRLPRIALIFGGRGLESEISVMGAENLFSLIDEKKYEKILVYIDKRGRFLLSCEKTATPSTLALGRCALTEAYPAMQGGKGGFRYDGSFLEIDAAFPLLHGDFGEDGRVQGALECASISFVGCDTLSGAICRDKTVVKAVASGLSVPVAKGVSIYRGDTDAVALVEGTLAYPVFVKPAHLGSSIGAGIALDRRELTERLEYALSLDSVALVEEKIDIERELECAYFSAGGVEIFTEPGEISGGGFYDYEKKYGAPSPSGQGCATFPEVRGFDGGECSVKEICDSVREYARRIVRALSVRDISRIDFFLSKDGELYFNEINTMPGFTDASLYIRLIDEAGISPREAVSMLLDSAVSRGT